MVEWLDVELRTAEISDYPNALNGLQLENRGEVGEVIAAVDASLPVILEAVAEISGPALLLVHHGLFWQGLQRITGPVFKKLEAALQADLAIYSSHLPLDVHAEWGNNVLLAQAVGLHEISPFLPGKSGAPMGVQGGWAGTRAELCERVAAAVEGPVHVCPGGPELPLRIGLVTGGAGSEVGLAAACGMDAFITGEGPHWSYPLAEELGINVLYAGHYSTETFGVRKLAAMVSERFGIPKRWVHHPTGL